MMQIDSFWQQILDHPENDAPRLHYADWLEAREPALAEFIRVQCQLERLEGVSPRAILELEDRERQLLAEHESDWVGELANFVDYWVFQRGFVEEISLSNETFCRFGQRLFRLAPLQDVHLDRIRGRVDALAECESLLKVRSLDLSNNHLRDSGLRRLLGSPFLAEVRRLNLSSTGLGDAAIAALIESPYLGSLRELYLCDNRISLGGLHELLCSPRASQLERVSVRYNQFDPSRVRFQDGLLV